MEDRLAHPAIIRGSVISDASDASFGFVAPRPAALVLRPLTLDVGTGRANSSRIEVTDRRTAAIEIAISAIAGTGPSLRLRVDHSLDGSLWLPNGETGLLASAGRCVLARSSLHRWLRVSHELLGTAPKATWGMTLQWLANNGVFEPSVLWESDPLDADEVEFTVTTLPDAAVAWDVTLLDSNSLVVETQSGSGTADGSGQMTGLVNVSAGSGGSAVVAARTASLTAFATSSIL